ncbi:MAG: ABC transporter ATP-binding protein [Planctomycetota bacterium]|nr:MAG: ABC transporter ATP-binding protein [Planctomycetota bacterium]
MEHVIEAHGLTKVYEGEVAVHAQRGIDLFVPPATFVAIMGPSGSGKSTLLHILGALEPPTDGRLLLEGTEIGKLSDEERTLLRRRRIGFVFQQFNLLPIFTAVENVALPLRLDGVAESEARKRASEALAMVGLEHRENHLPSKISGGEQQRVAVARALVTKPAIILADEPTGNLDSAAGERVIAMLRGLVDEQRQTLVLVTHDPAVASRADRVIHVRDGHIDEDSERPEEEIPAATGARPPR